MQHPPKNRFIRGIRDKLLLGFSSLAVCIVLFGSTVYPLRLERQATRALVAKTDGILNAVAHGVSARVASGDTAGVVEVLDGVATDRDVAWVILRDTLGRVITVRGSAWRSGPASAAPRAERELYVGSAPMVHRQRALGTVTLATSLRGLHAEVENARRFAMMVGLVILVTIVGVAYAVGTLITRPLRDVSETVKRITAGDFSLRARETGDVETTELVRSFNTMVDSVATAQAQLAEANRSLEARMRQRSEMIQSLLDVAPQAILAVDLEWRVTRWNKAAEKLFGWTAEEVIGQPLPYIPPEEREAFEQQRMKLLAADEHSPRELLRMHKDGTRIPVLLTTTTLRDSDQHPVGYLAVVTDLTERNSLEEQLRQSQKMEAVGRLAGGIAHDFNNILTVITATSSLMLEEEELTGSLRADVEEISTAALRAAALTKQLLSFSRNQVVNLQPLSLNDVLRGMRPMLRRLLPSNIELEVAEAQRLHAINADPMQMEQAVMNLVVNARDAMPEGGRLTIATGNATLDDAYAREHLNVTPGEYTVLTVTDTGIGMSRELMSRIFEPFFTTKPVGKGTGLGLATTYAIVERLGGHIIVESSPGKGATFRVHLPRFAEGEDELFTSGEESAADVSGRETVLLVEDELPVRVALRRTLGRLGYSVLEAADAEGGLAMVREHGVRIDVVVTDVMMPGMNGRALADQLLGLYPELRVVFISGYADEGVRERGLVDRTHAFLQKPFTGEELARTIRALLDPAARAA